MKEGKLIGLLSHVQTAGLSGSNTQHTGMAGAGFPTLTLLLCPAQGNDPAHYSHFKMAKEYGIHSSKVQAQGKLLL